MRNRRLYTLVVIAIMASISFLLKFIEFSLTMLFPDFLKIDFSDLPAIITAFAFGPLPGFMVNLLSNAAHMLKTETVFIGETANIIAGGSMILTAGFIYKKIKSRRGAIIGLGTGIVAMAVVGGLMNYFFILQAYEKFMGFKVDDVVALSSKIFPFIKTKLDVVLFTFVPFNVLKGILVSILTFIVYKRVSSFIKRY